MLRSQGARLVTLEFCGIRAPLLGLLYQLSGPIHGTLMINADFGDHVRPAELINDPVSKSNSFVHGEFHLFEFLMLCFWINF
jgi:hypothetical protein